MGRTKLGGYLLAAVFASFVLSGAAQALPCKGETVTTGDSKEAVAAKCGEAMLREQRVVKVEESAPQGKKTATTTTIEEWTYNFGPDEVMLTYVFENGKLADVRSAGYGRVFDPTNDTCRNGELLAVGDNLIETYLKCGEPLAKEKKEDKTTETAEGEKTITTTVSVVEWTYRYGRDLPGYTVRFEDGKAVDIRQRKFGE